MGRNFTGLVDAVARGSADRSRRLRAGNRAAAAFRGLDFVTMAVIIKWFTHSMEALFLLSKKTEVFHELHRRDRLSRQRQKDGCQARRANCRRNRRDRSLPPGTRQIVRRNGSHAT